MLYAATGIGSALLGCLVWWILPAQEQIARADQLAIHLTPPLYEIIIVKTMTAERIATATFWEITHIRKIVIVLIVVVSAALLAAGLVVRTFSMLLRLKLRLGAALRGVGESLNFFQFFF